MEIIRRIQKKLFPKYYVDSYQLEHRRLAGAILGHIESERGRTEPKLLRQADAYAREVLGWQGYAPWLYVYSAMAGGFREGWIPDNYYGKVVAPALKGMHGRVVSMKSMSGRLFNNKAFPDLAYHSNGLFLSQAYGILSEKDLQELLFANSEKLVFKLDASIQGKGVFFFEKSTFDAGKIRHLGSGVFQKYIQQHPFFEALMPASVATIRITTVLDAKGVASVRASYLRLGRTADTHVKSDSHIRIPVDRDSGELGEYGYSHDWTRIKKHPDTATTFAGTRIPAFEKCISTALELQKSVPFSRSIGWDIVVDTNNEVNVMECNGYHNDIKFSEATEGPCFAGLGWENLWRGGEEF